MENLEIDTTKKLESLKKLKNELEVDYAVLKSRIEGIGKSITSLEKSIRQLEKNGTVPIDRYRNLEQRRKCAIP